jgi:hypothetical protein
VCNRWLRARLSRSRRSAVFIIVTSEGPPDKSGRKTIQLVGTPWASTLGSVCLPTSPTGPRTTSGSHLQIHYSAIPLKANREEHGRLLWQLLWNFRERQTFDSIIPSAESRRCGRRFSFTPPICRNCNQCWRPVVADQHRDLGCERLSVTDGRPPVRRLAVAPIIIHCIDWQTERTFFGENSRIVDVGRSSGGGTAKSTGTAKKTASRRRGSALAEAAFPN